MALNNNVARDLKIVSVNPVMHSVVALADRVANMEMHVLIQGEHGVGKESLARYMHMRTAYRKGAFVSARCAAGGTSELEAIFFGEELPQGGAKQRGLLERAESGTLFLKDIASLPQGLQARLADVLNCGSFSRVQGKDRILFTGRVIASHTLPYGTTECAESALWRPLYSALNVVSLLVPTLRSRREDILELITQVLVHTGTRRPPRPADIFSEDELERLLQYDWPGNAAELIHMVKRVAISRGLGETGLSVLPNQDVSPHTQAAGESINVTLDGNLRSIERQIVKEVILRNNGNKAAAARELGLHRKTLYRILKVHREQSVQLGT